MVLHKGTPLALFVLSVLTRLAYLAVFRPPFESVYWGLSSTLLHNESDFEPLYPMFLGGLRLVIGAHPFIVQIGQALVASLGAVYLYRLALTLSGHERIAVIAAALYAIDPLLIRQASASSDLALVTVLLIAFAFYFVTATRTSHVVMAGTVVGLAVATRMMVLPLVPMALVLLLKQRRVHHAVVLATTVSVLVTPLVIHNWLGYGSWTPTRSGINLYIGNSRFTSAMLPDYDVDLLEDQADHEIRAHLPHLSASSPEYRRATNALLTKLAIESMSGRPMETLRQKALNVAYFYSPRLVPFYVAGPDTRAVDNGGRVVVEHPHQRSMIEQLSYSLFYTPIFVGAIWGVYLSRQSVSGAAILWCIAATFTAVHALYFPATRYRAPMEFVLLLYASVAIDRVLAGWFSHTVVTDPPHN
jgi:4-amino-4-deoxy-L-arabinose transferase-like glycosyltransferase